ncbi:MAG: phosphoribosyltransferase family protein [Candidatus ainarchaeum sp.]|nr:phosphoribosyltransferase family protein [Candidatus ainarchaeum sp.]
MKFEYYNKYINYQTKTHRRDLTPLFANKQIFKNLIIDLVTPFKKPTKIVSIDALGFILGAASANYLKIGFVTIRKENKLFCKKNKIYSTQIKDYSNKIKILEMNKDLITKKDKILIIDDWIETGAQIKGAIKLIKKTGCEIIGISCFGVYKNKSTNKLFKEYKINYILEVEIYDD